MNLDKELFKLVGQKQKMAFQIYFNADSTISHFIVICTRNGNSVCDLFSKFDELSVYGFLLEYMKLYHGSFPLAKVEDSDKLFTIFQTPKNETELLRILSEIYYNQQTKNVKNIYSFVGSLDSYDFEARVYDPAVGRFTQPDPLAWDTPWISPYSYCASNPIRYIDPTGTDYYNVDKHGNITLSSKNDDNFDRLISISNTNNYIDIEKSFMASQLKKKIQIETDNGNQEGIVETYSSKDSDKVYEFMLNNTDAEWCIVDFVDRNGNFGTSLGTQHLQDSDASQDYMADEIIQNGGEIISAGHIHPNDDEIIVTKGDVKVAGHILNKCPNALLYISTKSHGTRYYDNHTEANMLKEIIVYP